VSKLTKRICLFGGFASVYFCNEAALINKSVSLRRDAHKLEPFSRVPTLASSIGCQSH